MTLRNQDQGGEEHNIGDQNCKAGARHHANESFQAKFGGTERPDVWQREYYKSAGFVIWILIRKRPSHKHRTLHESRISRGGELRRSVKASLRLHLVSS